MTTRKRKAYESKDVADGAGRMIRGLVKRAGTGDQEALYHLVQLQAQLAEAITEAGAQMHVQADYSYTTLAGELGISRQAARQRFAKRVAELTADAEPYVEHNGVDVTGCALAGAHVFDNDTHSWDYCRDDLKRAAKAGAA